MPKTTKTILGSQIWTTGAGTLKEKKYICLFTYGTPIWVTAGCVGDETPMEKSCVPCCYPETEVAPCDCSCEDLENIIFTVEIGGESCTVAFSFRGGEQEQGEACVLHYLVTDPDPCLLPHDISVQEIQLECEPWSAPWTVSVDFVHEDWNHIATFTLPTACPKPGEHQVDVLDGDGQVVAVATIGIAYSVP